MTYKNLYIILVGEPGIGKSQVMKDVQVLLASKGIESEVAPWLFK